MAVKPKYNLGTFPTFLDPTKRSWIDVIYQRGKLVLDSELVLNQDIKELLECRLLAEKIPSGWVRNQSRTSSYNDFSFDNPWLPGPVLNPDFVANSFHVKKLKALVAGFLLDIEYSNIDTPEDNLILLESPTIYNGAPTSIKRTDFVFLEVWIALISSSPTASGTLLVADPVTVAIGDTVSVDGIVLTGVVVPPGPNQFLISPGSATQTAKNIKNSINANVGTVTSTSSGPLVTIRSNVSGTAGNLILLSSSQPSRITPSNATLSGGSDTPNKPSQDTIYIHGNTDSSVTVALPDDIEDPTLKTETTKRLQIQYRIRTTGSSEGVNFVTEADGFSNPNIFAQGAQGSPLLNYPFVPADRNSVLANSSAVAYDIEDEGLWIAGDGTLTAANDLGTADGYVYSIPLSFVFRRNNAFPSGWNPEINTNGALLYNHGAFVNPFLYAPVGVGESDRPDGYFADAIVYTDILDLRRHVDLGGLDFESELQWQIQSLMDGEFQTWAIDTASKQELGFGSGDVSTRNLICNEVGRLAAQGGNPPLSGNTTRGETIRNFDHFARRFGDQPVVERVILPYVVSSTVPGLSVVREPYAVGFAGWAEGDELNFDSTLFNVTNLGDFDPANNTVAGVAGVFNTFAPMGTIITDVLSVYHDDGNFGVIVPQEAQIVSIVGLGTSLVTIKLDNNITQVNGGLPLPLHNMVGNPIDGDVGSQRRIFVELEITYPLGEGTTDTPVYEITPSSNPFPFGPMIENDVPFGGTQKPTDMENPLAPSFRKGFREVNIEYVANDPTGGGNPGVPIGGVTLETVVSRDPLTVVTPRRIYGDGITSISITDQNDLVTRVTDDPNTEYGSSSRIARLQNTGIAPAVPLSGAGQTLVAIQYFAQDAVPNYGPLGGGYQQSIYYRTNAPQTCGVKEGTISVPGNAIFPYTGNDPLPNPISLEVLSISDNVWSGQVGMGSTELPFPYYAPLDQIPMNDGRTEIVPPPSLFPGEWYFAASANISISDFDAQVGTLALHALVPADGTTEWVVGGALAVDAPFKDTEFRAVFPVINNDGARPTPMAQSLSGITRHKVFVPVLAKSLQDSALFRKGEVLLVVLSRYAELDENNVIKFQDIDNRSGGAIFRSKNLLQEKS